MALDIAGTTALDEWRSNVAFDPLGWLEIVSFTAAGSVRSQAVMQRLGMRREPEWDFEHPFVPAGHRVRPQVFYRLFAD